MAVAFPLIIALLSLFLLKFLWEDWHVLRGDSVTVEAEVVEHRSKLANVGSGIFARGTSGSGILTTSWNAVYAFTTPDGATHRVYDPVWGTNQAAVPPIGSTMTLRYLPRSPESAAPYTFVRRFWAYAAVLGMMGALAFAWFSHN
jgi:hypothetical protein